MSIALVPLAFPPEFAPFGFVGETIKAPVPFGHKTKAESVWLWLFAMVTLFCVVVVASSIMYGIAAFLATFSLLTGVLQPLMLGLLIVFCCILFEWATND